MKYKNEVLVLFLVTIMGLLYIKKITDTSLGVLNIMCTYHKGKLSMQHNFMNPTNVKCTGTNKKIIFNGKI